MHLTRAEQEVLEALVFCATGFRPSLKYLADKTGRTTRTIGNIKHALSDRGIIGLRQDTLIIDWDRLWLLASLDPALTCRNPKVARVGRDNIDSDSDQPQWSPTLDPVFDWLGDGEPLETTDQPVDFNPQWNDLVFFLCFAKASAIRSFIDYIDGHCTAATDMIADLTRFARARCDMFIRGDTRDVKTLHALKQEDHLPILLAFSAWRKPHPDTR